MTKLVIACTARTLFDLEESHHVYMTQGVDAYSKYQLDNEDNVLDPGPAFGMVKKLLALNAMQHEKLVEIVLLSRNSAETGLRVFNSISAHGLDISRAAFTRGESVAPYIRPFGVDLFLSSDPESVKAVLKEGYAAATVLPSATNIDKEQLKIAFDGDAVVFSDESERVFQEQGLTVFTSEERKLAREPMNAGPFKKLLEKLHELQGFYEPDDSPIRTALVTARAAATSERVIRTLCAWNLRVDEIFFLGGADKGEVLKQFGADIFFDDQEKHCESARRHVVTCHVPSSLNFSVIK